MNSLGSIIRANRLRKEQVDRIVEKAEASGNLNDIKNAHAIRKEFEAQKPVGVA